MNQTPPPRTYKKNNIKTQQYNKNMTLIPLIKNTLTRLAPPSNIRGTKRKNYLNNKNIPSSPYLIKTKKQRKEIHNYINNIIKTLENQIKEIEDKKQKEVSRLWDIYVKNINQLRETYKDKFHTEIKELIKKKKELKKLKNNKNNKKNNNKNINKNINVEMVKIEDEIDIISDNNNKELESLENKYRDEYEIQEKEKEEKFLELIKEINKKINQIIFTPPDIEPIRLDLTETQEEAQIAQAQFAPAQFAPEQIPQQKNIGNLVRLNEDNINWEEEFQRLEGREGNLPPIPP